MRKIIGLFIFLLQLPVLLLLIMAMVAPYIPPDKLVYPAFAGLSFLWIFLANLILTVLLLFLSGKMAIPGIIILLLGLYDVSQHVRFSPDVPEKAHGVKFLSYNCQGLYSNYEKTYGKVLSDSIARFIAGENPDIICLQEFRGVKEEEVASFMEKFSEEINAQSFHYQKYFVNHSQNSALCLITLSKFPIIYRNAILLGKRRIGMYTDIVALNDTIRVFNIHLQSTRLVQKDIDFVMTTPDIQNTDPYINIYSKLSEAYRLRAQQARLIALEISKSPHPVMVCGDFNDTPTSFAYHRIAKNFDDAFVKSGKGIGNTYNNKRLPPIRIDYILYEKTFQSTSFSVLKAPYSDHFPITATIDKKPHKQ